MLYGIGAGALLTATASAHHYSFWTQKPEANCRTDVLSRYGFNTVEKKEALTFLMRKARIIQSNESVTQLFPQRENNTLLLADIAHFVNVTQKHFSKSDNVEEKLCFS